MNRIFILAISILFSLILSQECDAGYTEINGLCFHDGDLSFIQKMIDNSYQSGIDLGCEEGDSYCGSPNPYMDSSDSWFWKIIDGQDYYFADGDGIVEPLELGIQEWNNGRLTDIMCGAYIYCQLSGPIPEEISTLSEAETIRLEYNYLSGFVPDDVCELLVNTEDYLAFDLTGNYLCPPYPDCVGSGDFWFQDTSSCTEVGDVNFDGYSNILDVILAVSFILDENSYDYQEFVASDYNLDGFLDILDVVALVDSILQGQ